MHLIDRHGDTGRASNSADGNPLLADLYPLTLLPAYWQVQMRFEDSRLQSRATQIVRHAAARRKEKEQS
ncbi:hypothetical protein [Variovorax paradoxus]|uniref:hypothetical protein n=1 Tax=Variovorax paradoxus TaxID=34073 RepID=UPI00068644A0|nr:hypothetical protein [Variovorax paradoxus]